MKYQLFPELTSEEYEELKKDIQERGVQIPIELDEEGNILDGHHRKQICEELGITDYAVVVRDGLSEEEKRLHVRKLNLARRHLNRTQKESLRIAQIKETPELSDRQIAKGLGVNHETVGATRKKLESIGEIRQCDRKTTDGRTYPRQRTITTKADEVEKVTEIRNIRPSLLEEVSEGRLTVGEAYRQTQRHPRLLEVPKKQDGSFHISNKVNDWYTPPEVIESTRLVLRSIELDPASSEFAQKTVQAKKYFTKENNGLCESWNNSRVWLNPPYSMPEIAQFIEKLLAENIDNYIVLTNNSSDTKWFHSLLAESSLVCFTKGRLSFVNPDSDSLSARQGQTLFYRGDNDDLFTSEFRKYGEILKVVA